MTQAHRGRRRGANFTVRVTDEERVILEEERTRIGGPKGLGPWLLWRALESRPLLGSASSSGASAPAVGPELGVSERVILDLCGRWWALENPSGYLGSYLGTARDTFEPYDFGDPWTKRTQLWGDFTIPKRGPFVVPDGSACDRNTAAERAITRPGFARAFFEANP